MIRSPNWFCYLNHSLTAQGSNVPFSPEILFTITHEQNIICSKTHSRPQSSSLLRMTDGEKSSGELWTKLFRYLLLVETKKARLIGQSVTR